MSWFRVRRSRSGFTFEDRVSSLLENLNYNIKFTNVEFDCITPGHLKSLHELDHWADFLSGRNQKVPTYAEDVMVVSCTKILADKDKVELKKRDFLEAIACFNENSQLNPAGLIVTSSNMPECSPDLGDGIYFWDLRRCFFYAWKAYYVKSKKRKFNSWEQELPNKNSFVFRIDDPTKKENNFGECEIFFDAIEPLDLRTLEKLLNEVRRYVIREEYMEKRKIYVNTHTINGYVGQIVNRKKDIEKAASKNNIEFELKFFYDYSVVPWEPLTST